MLLDGELGAVKQQVAVGAGRKESAIASITCASAGRSEDPSDRSIKSVQRLLLLARSISANTLVCRNSKRFATCIESLTLTR